jgi:hypothetical protein
VALLGKQDLRMNAGRKHSVGDLPDALVVVQVALAAAGETLDGFGMELVALDQLRRCVAGAE